MNLPEYRAKRSDHVSRRGPEEKRTSPFRLPAGQAFSLVEIVLALGIVSFCLVALMGLFSVGLNASKQAADDTTIASMTAQILGEVCGQTNIPTGKTYYFDRHGQQEGDLSDPAVFYRCEFSVADRNVPLPSNAAFTQSVPVVILKFLHPANAPKPRTNTIVATLFH